MNNPCIECVVDIMCREGCENLQKYVVEFFNSIGILKVNYRSTVGLSGYLRESKVDENIGEVRVLVSFRDGKNAQRSPYVKICSFSKGLMSRNLQGIDILKKQQFYNKPARACFFASIDHTKQHFFDLPPKK